MKNKKVLSLVLAIVMLVGMLPLSAFAADAVYTDGTYTKTATVEPDEWEDFSAYDLNVDVVVEGGKVSDVKLSEDNAAVSKRNMSYCEDALEGVAPQIIANNGVEGVDVVSEATCSSKAIISAVSAALAEAEAEEEPTEEPTEAPTEEPTEEPTEAPIEEPTEAPTEAPEEPTEAPSEEPVSQSGYVLMNIPYDEFYAAEGVSGVDAVTTATVKTYNQNMAGGSYHEGYEAADPISNAVILGVTYPVYVSDMSVLEGLTEVTDADTATIDVASGKSSLTEKEVSGTDLLFASGDYAYYVMSNTPSSYKTLSVSGNSFSFSAASAKHNAAEGMEVTMAYGGHYTDIEFNVSADEITDTCVVNAITLETSDGGEYALRHVEDIWRKTSLGWNWDSLDGNGLAGKTITAVTYYVLDNGVYSIYEYDVNETVKLNPGEVTGEFTDANTVVLSGLPADIENPVATVKTKVGRGETATVIAENVSVKNGQIVTTDAAKNGTYVITVVSDNYGDVSFNADYFVSGPGYVLMNIPYDEFYAGEGVEGVDAVTTATVKTYNQNMVGGSYHEGYEAVDPITDAVILGITYPVYMDDLSVLKGLTEVTDETTATIAVATGKSSMGEAEVSGTDVLFASGSYAFYIMSETPNSYKTMTVNEDGTFSFSAVSAESVAEDGVEVEMAYGGHYTDIEFNVSAAEITDTCVVNAITLETSDGEKYALRHVEDIWRKTSLGWNWDSLDGNGLAGKTITNVTYYILDNGVYSIYEYVVEETVKLNPGEVTASFEDDTTVVLSGLPADIETPVATVKTKVGRGETATVIAENVAVVPGDGAGRSGLLPEHRCRAGRAGGGQ